MRGFCFFRARHAGRVQGKYEIRFHDEDFTPLKLKFCFKTPQGGIEFHELLGEEFEAAFGLGAEEIDGGSGAEAELKNQFGGFIVARYPIIQNLDVLGHIGYTSGELQTSNNGVTSDADLDGFAFGIGGEYMFTEQLGVRGDYTRVEVDDDTIDGGVNMFSIAGVYKFGAVR